MEGRSRDHLAVENKKEVLLILSMCLWPYVCSMQSACAILSPVARPAVTCIATLSHKSCDFEKKKLVNTKRVF
jgi:hypothetical protein